MATRRKGFNYIQSTKDQSLYTFVYMKGQDQPIPKLSTNFSIHQLLKKDYAAVTAIIENQSSETLKMPFSAVVVSQSQIPQNPLPSKRIELFSVRLCQHCPVNILQQLTTSKPNIQNEITSQSQIASKPIIKTRETCAHCDEPIWYYFSPEETEINYRQFLDVFEDLDLDRMQWNVVLNQYFTQNIRIATFQGEEFYLHFSGKISFLHDLHALPPKDEIEDDHVLLKVKKVICKHEKIVDKMCQFCLTTLSPKELQDFRMFLFQVQDESNTKNSFVNGLALEQQEQLFIKSILDNKKAVLILDIDNTILHSIQLFKIPEHILEQVEEYVIIPEVDPEVESFYRKFEKTIAKIRPYFSNFLEKIINIYEIYIYTKGTRIYAEWVCKAIRKKYSHLLENTKHFTNTRILSRDDDPILHKKSMNNIVPKKTEPFLILDDRRDVWDHSPHCVYTKEYFYFFMMSEGNTDSSQVKIEAIKWESGGGSLISSNNCPEKKEENSQEDEHDVALATNGEENQETNKQKEQEKVKEEPEKEKRVTKGQFSIINSIQKDYFLLFAGRTLITLHELYFDQLQKKKKQIPNMKSIHLDYRKRILKGLNAVLLIPNHKTNVIYRRAMNLGLTVIEGSAEPKHLDLVIRANDLEKTLKSGTMTAGQFSKETIKKLKYYSQVMNVPVVSESWINLCYEYTYAFPYNNFKVEDACCSSIFEDGKLCERSAIVETIEEAASTFLN